MRKFLSVSLCVLSLLAFSVPVLAAEDDAPPDWLLTEEDKQTIAITEIFTAAVGWVGTVGETIVGNSLLLVSRDCREKVHVFCSGYADLS